jgi:hypothetical protein
MVDPTCKALRAVDSRLSISVKGVLTSRPLGAFVFIPSDSHSFALILACFGVQRRCRFRKDLVWRRCLVG